MIFPPVYALLYILAVHWVADFVLQSDKVALNKADDVGALLTHVVLYTTAMAFCMVIFFAPVNPLEFVNLIGFLSINAVLHFCTDFVTSKISKRLWLASRRHDFFVLIGFDQLIHQVTLGLTMMTFLYGGLLK